MKKLLLVGAAGLVGQSVLRKALADARVTQVVAPTRRPLPAQPRLENPLVDFDALPADAPWWKIDAVICTLGTTIRKAGSPVAFRQVDFEYPLAVATLARRQGAQAFALTSSVGANPNSRTFYLRTKGEIEWILAGCGFPSLTIVRPSFIAGRRSERRPMAALALGVFRGLRWLVPRRYRPVPAARIAQALLQAALDAPAGTHFIESEEI